MDHVALIAKYAGRVADLVTPDNASQVVPSCPDWSLLDLAIHLGKVHAFWAASIRDGNPENPWDGERYHPDHSISEISWCREQTSDLVAAISVRGDDSPCWTWWEEPRTTGAVARHQVQEAAIHCWDAENAVGTPSPISLDVARDGIEEYISVHRFGFENLEIIGFENIDINGIKFQEIDTENVWYINPEKLIEGTVTASASDLVLFLNGRLGLKDVKIEGERASIERLTKATPEINS